ncbi:MAG: hypothetical protein WCK09_21910 [Bacteroidota bacterium]
MKKFRKFLLTLSFIFTSIFLFNAMADEPLDNPPPPPGGGHGGGGNSQGAPIDGGLSILLILGAGYGAKKRYTERKRKNEPDSEDQPNILS